MPTKTMKNPDLPLEKRSQNQPIAPATMGEEAASSSPEHASTPSSSVTARDIFAINAQENTAKALAADNASVVASSYKPSGRIGALGMPMLVLWPLLVGVLVGYGHWIVTQSWNSVFITNLLLGIVLGCALFPAIYAGKVRNTRAAAASGTLAALVALLCWHTLAARQLRNDYIDYIMQPGVEAKAPQPSQAARQQARARLEQMMTPATAARLYVQDRLMRGITLSSSSRSRGESATRVAGAWYWLLAAFELALSALMAAIVAQSFAARRFSEASDSWYRKKLLAVVNPAQCATVIKMMRDGDWRGAGTLSRASKTDSGYAVTIYDCAPQSDGVVTVTCEVNKKMHHFFESEVSAQNITQLRGV